MKPPWPLKNARRTLQAACAVLCAITNAGYAEISAGETNATVLEDSTAGHAVLAGHWEADITGEGSRRLRLSLDLSKNTKSEWIASMGLPSEHKTGLVVKDVVVAGKSVKFIAVELMMAPFDLALGPDGRLKGRIAGPGAQSVEFKRTGEAKVELIPASPAVSRELEGDWKGSLTTPNGSIPVEFHFKNQPDKTVLATFGSGDGAVPLDNVKQTDRKVEFGIRVAHGSFSGTLNPEGAELVGQFTHEGNSVPLTLRKSNNR